jgi:hypothetical protein
VPVTSVPSTRPNATPDRLRASPAAPSAGPAAWPPDPSSGARTPRPSPVTPEHRGSGHQHLTGAALVQQQPVGTGVEEPAAQHAGARQRHRDQRALRSPQPVDQPKQGRLPARALGDLAPQLSCLCRVELGLQVVEQRLPPHVPAPGGSMAGACQWAAAP